MTDFRLVGLDQVHGLVRILDALALEIHDIGARLSSLADPHAPTLWRISNTTKQWSERVRVQTAAAEPGSFWQTSTGTILLDRDAATTSLHALIAANKERAWSELWEVVEELNRLHGLGIHSGSYRDGMVQDYNTLATLVDKNLIYFDVDRSAPPGTRSDRAGYRAGVWIGPLDADHVLVMIPGMNTTTASWLETNLPDGEELQQQSESLASQHDLGSVAVVPLLSYEVPQSFLDAPLGHFWRDGSTETAAVLDTLPLEGRHVVGWGHSYGAAVLGATSAIDEVFDDLIMVGGAGTGTESIDELGVGSDHLYVATDWNDPIRLVPNDYHGVNPTTLPHVEIPTAPTTDLDPWKALLSIPWFLIDGLPDHDYLQDEVAMRAFAAIAVGLDELSD